MLLACHYLHSSVLNCCHGGGALTHNSVGRGCVGYSHTQGGHTGYVRLVRGLAALPHYYLVYYLGVYAGSVKGAL
jgi:hypothetical protein